MKTLRALLIISCMLAVAAGCKPASRHGGNDMTLEVSVDGIQECGADQAADSTRLKSITSPEVSSVYVKAFQKSTRVHLPHGGVPGAVASLTRQGSVWKGTLSLPGPSGDVVFLAYAVAGDGRHLYSGTYQITNIQDDPGLPFTIIVQGASDGTTAAYGLGDWGPGGGWIYYDAGNYSEYGWRYLEAAPHTWKNSDGTDPSNVWSNVYSTLIGITDLNDKDLIGEGQSNTAAIIAQPGHTTSAAKTCSDLAFNAMDDWYLPSLEELSMMRLNLYLHSPSLGGFSGSSYWASTEYSDTAGWVIKFSTGASRGQAKDSNSSTIGRIRPTRAL